MKKQIKFLGIIIMMMAATAVIAAGTQQDKDKGQKKEQQKGNDKPQKVDGKENKGQGKYKTDEKSDQGKNDNGNKGKGNSDNKGQGNNDNRGQGNSDDKNEGKNDNNNGNGNDKGKKGDVDLTDGFKWDRNSFKDRSKVKNQDKVTICHKFNNNNETPVTIRVSSNALKAHMNHGDVQGDCPKVDNTRYSEKYEKRRADYYNELQAANEQVIYSQSILDYAKLRLAQSQQALAATDANRYTMAQIQERQATVTELEQNVSLLETLVGVGTQLLVNKLTN